MKKRVGITGGTGFIGSYFIRDYAEKYEIVVVTSREFKEIPSRLHLNGVRFVKGDYSVDSFCRAFEGCDAIIHLGAKVPNRISGFGSVSEYAENITSTEALLQATTRLHIPKFIDISSVAVYDKKKTPIKEDDAFSPVNAYGVSKAAVEIMAEAYAKEFGFNVISLRLSQVIGYRKWDHECFFSILQEYPLVDKPIPVYGRGTHTWDIIYVKDVTRSIEAAIESENASGAYNIASGKETSNLMLAKAFIQGYNSQSQIEFVPEKDESKLCWWCDVEKANRELNFKCKYDLLTMTKDIKKEYCRGV